MSDSEVKFLLIAANPSTHELEKEISEIERVLSSSKYGNQFDFELSLIGTVDDIGNYIRAIKPDIFHFSGHGHPDGEIKVGNKFVPVEYLADVFSDVQSNTRCVVINGCYSELQARSIAQHIDCVVGTTRAIRETQAITFAAEFYSNIGNGVNVATAFRRGRDLVLAEWSGGEFVPDQFSLLPTEQDSEKIVLVPVSIAPALIAVLNNASSNGEEGDRNTGSFYTYTVSLHEFNEIVYEENLKNEIFVQKITIDGQWKSHVYKAIKVFGATVDQPWGEHANPQGSLRLTVEVKDGEIVEQSIDIRKHDDDPNNYAAKKVDELVRRKITEAT